MVTIESYRKKPGSTFYNAFPGFLVQQYRTRIYIRMVTKALLGNARRIAFASFSGILIKISGV